MWILESLEKRLGVEICATCLCLFSLLFAVAFLYKCCRMLQGLQRRSIMRRRGVEYALPSGENRYLRDRLNTALRVDNDEKEKSEYVVCLSYARELLAKLKSAELTQAERVELQNLEALFSLYFYKKEWSVKDLRTVNDGCARLLKLSAKYAV